MTIVRVDEREFDSEIGWKWDDCNGEEEMILAVDSIASFYWN